MKRHYHKIDLDKHEDFRAYHVKVMTLLAPYKSLVQIGYRSIEEEYRWIESASNSRFAPLSALSDAQASDIITLIHRAKSVQEHYEKSRNSPNAINPIRQMLQLCRQCLAFSPRQLSTELLLQLLNIRFKFKHQLSDFFATNNCQLPPVYALYLDALTDHLVDLKDSVVYNAIATHNTPLLVSLVLNHIHESDVFYKEDTPPEEAKLLTAMEWALELDRARDH